MQMRQADPLISALSDADLLRLRMTNSRIRDALKQCIVGPYSSKAQFVVAISGAYRILPPINQIVLTSKFDTSFTQKNDKGDKYLKAAYDYYTETLHSTSNYPFMIYRRHDVNTLTFIKAIKDFANGEDIKKNGRQYNPLMGHNWSVNQMWLLAQVHHERNAVIFHPVCYDSIFRHDTNSPSAFIREIAALMKIGYFAKRRHNGLVDLIAPQSLQHEQVTYDSLTPNQTDIDYAIASFNKI
jgi:hypothetical protein